MEKSLGKITNAEVQLDGRGRGIVGLSLTFESKGWGVSTFIVLTEESLKELSKTFELAEVSSVSELVDCPVEVTFEDRMLKSWRILTEVI